ncbi:MAG: hypothetical protein BWY88_00824 [Synergistetes bacterium ADurb.Bin520]|nr:MAG: hypothetical protein BWY88_00824 [Synergistetes bacterium ADurb.Bin520]
MSASFVPPTGDSVTGSLGSFCAGGFSEGLSPARVVIGVGALPGWLPSDGFSGAGGSSGVSPSDSPSPSVVSGRSGRATATAPPSAGRALPSQEASVGCCTATMVVAPSSPPVRRSSTRATSPSSNGVWLRPKTTTMYLPGSAALAVTILSARRAAGPGSTATGVNTAGSNTRWKSKAATWFSPPDSRRGT